MIITLINKKMELQKSQTPTNSEILLAQLGTQERDYNIKPSLVLVIGRLNQDLKNIDDTIDDICTEFPRLKIKDLKEILRLGALAQYGRTYKLSTQEICFWIREYYKQQNAKRLKI